MRKILVTGFKAGYLVRGRQEASTPLSVFPLIELYATFSKTTDVLNRYLPRELIHQDLSFPFLSLA